MTLFRSALIYFHNDPPLGARSTGFLFSVAISSFLLKINLPGFPGGAVVENLPANAGDTGSSPGLGRSHMPRSS